MKLLLVGDPHATADELGDVEKLMDAVMEHRDKADAIVFLGDMHNNFSLTNIHVTAFWTRRLQWLKPLMKNVFLVVGNHDMTGDGNPHPNALLPYRDLATVISQQQDFNNILFLPYYSDPNLFKQRIKESPRKLIICHQEFNGAQFDNGFYAPGGVDPAILGDKKVISGHIHLPQKFGNVWYPGAPRWRTISDAGVKRYLYLIDVDDTEEANYKLIDAFDTGLWCKVLHRVDITPDKEFDGALLDKDEYRVHISGPQTFVKEQLAKHKHLADEFKMKFTTHITDDKVIRVRESVGVNTAFTQYIESFKPKHGTPIQTLKDTASQRL